MEALAVRPDHIDAELLGVLPARPWSWPRQSVLRSDEKASHRLSGDQEAVRPAGIALHVSRAGQIAQAAGRKIKHPDIGSVAVACRNEGDA